VQDFLLFRHSSQNTNIKEDKLIDVCKALSLPPFVQIEINFLKEYLLLMAPIAQSIDILQGDQTCCLGFVLPTLTTLKKKLQRPELKHANALRDSLLQGINKRFDSYFQDKEFLLAAVTHPRFKLSWLDDSTLRARCTELLEDAVNVLAEKNAASATASQPTGKPHQSDASDSDDFFSFKDTGPSQIQDHLAYLNDKDKELHMLDRHVNVKPLFIRYNTTLPSSAPVERLFSSGAIILSKRRSRLSDTLFEKLLLLKVNKHFW
jgi:hypothetical protein